MKLFSPNLLLAILLSLIIFSCSSDDNGGSQEIADFTVSNFTDDRDDTVYKTVKIGDQVWFAENLNYTLENNQSTCYDESASNCLLYGRLYRADDAQNVCPSGWHLPSEEEWQELFDYLGGTAIAVNLLGVGSTFQNTEIQFNLLPAGRFWSSQVGYEFINDTGFYWTSTAGGSQFATTRFVQFTPGVSLTINQENTGRKMSCRCVED
ncbi:FISUMP domain-containing protein [Flagellimonas sp.]|uniref:FISUMP domain-containing protein n=1 Tax=Flagellimonas sp. TaxID=2058762 RepID=UPI003BAB5007